MPEKDSFENSVMEYQKNMRKLIAILKSKKIIDSNFAFSKLPLVNGKGGVFSLPSRPPENKLVEVVN